MDKRTEIQNKIIEKAMTDEAFKKELIANPKEALKKEFNIELPEDINVKVLEETEKQYYLVIPACPDDESAANLIW